MKRVVFLFPHPTAGPTGGYKVVYEYANRLAEEGYQVRIVYSGSIYWSRKSLFHKITCCIRYIQNIFKDIHAEVGLLWMRGYTSTSLFHLINVMCLRLTYM